MSTRPRLVRPTAGPGEIRPIIAILPVSWVHLGSVQLHINTMESMQDSILLGISAFRFSSTSTVSNPSDRGLGPGSNQAVPYTYLGQGKECPESLERPHVVLHCYA